MHVDDPAVPDDVAITAAERALRGCGLIAEKMTVLGGSVLRAGRSFMLPTLANCDALTVERDAVAGAGIANLVLSTQDISSGVFYLPEILNASTEKLKAL